MVGFVSCGAVNVSSGRNGGATCKKRKNAVVRMCGDSANAPPQQQKVRMDPYRRLGFDEGVTPTAREIRNAYLKLARRHHPDVAVQTAKVEEFTDVEFEEMTQAYDLLSDPERRKIFDDFGYDGLDALDTLRTRKESANLFEGMDPFEVEQMTEMTGGMMGSFEAAEDASDSFDPQAVEHDDYCPRTVEEALFNIRHHPDIRCRYYIAWWIARFKIREAEKTLVEIAQSGEMEQPEFLNLRKRIVQALGKIAATRPVSTATLDAMARTITHPDYKLRESTADGLMYIAQRNGGKDGFPQYILNHVEEMIKEGFERTKTRRVNTVTQESQFDFDHLEPAVAEKLKAIMRQRQQEAETRDRYQQTAGYNMTEDMVEPWEKLIKTAANLGLFHLIEYMDEYERHPIPLVRYAAKKFQYMVNGDTSLPEELAENLRFGTDSPLAQSVVSLDLGDLGYVPGAMRMINASSVPTSTKVLSLVKMLDRNDWDVTNPELKDIFDALDVLVTQ